MADKVSAAKGITPDWFVRGVLTKVGDIFDRLTGRGWKPSSSLATSELIEKLKALLDGEVREDALGCKFVPNNIKLKMQWDKFSTDSEKGLRKLEAEMLSAVVDHINDKRYFTHAPLALEIKPDYFTPGVRLLVSFDRFADEDHEAAINRMPGETGKDGADATDIPPAPASERSYVAVYTLNGVEKSKRLIFSDRTRVSVGRTKENDLFIDDPSISKIHASLTVSGDGDLVVADTGSTNGTFIGDQRIAYGKTAVIGTDGLIKFGSVEVRFRSEQILRPAAPVEGEKTEIFQPRQLEFSSRMQTLAPVAASEEPKPGENDAAFEPAPTQPSVPAPTLPSIDLENEG